MSSTSTPVVLVTGANGYVGTATVLELIKQGYKVKATVRRLSSAEAWNKQYPAESASVEWIALPELTDLAGMTAAAQGVDYLIHVASPFTLVVKDNVNDMLIPAREGTLTALRAAAANPRIKRVVITSSFAAIADLMQGLRPGYTYSEKDFNPATWDEAAASDNGAFVYCASKVIAEKAAWDFIEQEHPQFSLTVFNPPMVFGPAMQPYESMDKLNESVDQLWNLFSGKEKEMPPTGFPIFVDVRDLASLQVSALTNNKAANQRYFSVSAPFPLDDAVRIASAAFPEQAARMTPLSGKPAPVHYAVDNSKVKRDFGIEFRPFEETITDTAAALFKAEKEFAQRL